MEELAIWIVERDFGKEVASLAGALCSKVSNTLLNIKKNCSLSLGDLRLYLLLLIKHNLVEISGSEESPSYSFSYEEAIHRFRLPRFLRQAEEIFDEVSSSILLVMMREGRLTLQGCIEHIQDLCAQERIEEAERDTYTPEKIKRKMGKLLDSGFLIQINVNYEKELHGDSIYSEIQRETGKEPSNPAKRGGRGSSLTRRRAITPKLMTPSKKVKTSSEKTLGQESKSLTHKSEVQGQMGRMEEEKKDEGLFVDGKTGQELFFRVNFRRFIHELRVEQTFNIFYKRLDSINAATLAQTILLNPPVLGKAASVRRSDSLTLSKIVSCTPQLQSVDEKSIERLLNQILQDQ